MQTLTRRLDLGVGLEVVVRRKTYIKTKFLKGMAKIAKRSKREDLMPLTFQLSTTWKEAIPDERNLHRESNESM